VNWRPTLPRSTALALVVLATSAMLAPARADVYPVTVLRALDKVTARVSTLYAPVGETVRFGSLSITSRVCDKRPPEEPPESAAFLSIVESRPDRPPSVVFSGWMFASSPGLSPLQHPVYDLWVLDCLPSLPSAPANTSGGGSP
jgi:hypothetical protein